MVDDDLVTQVILGILLGLIMATIVLINAWNP